MEKLWLDFLKNNPYFFVTRQAVIFLKLILHQL